MKVRIEDPAWPQVGSVSEQGQISIPSMIRAKLKIKRGTLVKIRCTEKTIVLTPIKPFEELRGALKKYIQ